MEKSPTYRLTAFLLAVTILIGIAAPTGLHAFSHQMCDMMEGDEMHANHTMPSSHMDMDMMMNVDEHASCLMKSQHGEHASHQTDDCDMPSASHASGFDCACGVEQAPPATEASLFNKVKLPVQHVVQLLAEIHTETQEVDTHAIQLSDSYSPSPIFLANESFLI